MLNPYAVPNFWDQLPFDNKLMVWKIVGEQERVERYRARVLRFKLRGFVGEDEWKQLSQGIKDWLRLDRSLSLSERAQPNSAGFQRLEGIRRSLEASLRGLLTSLFRCDEADILNVKGEAWTQMAFHICAIEPRDDSDVAEIRATTADGLHRIRLLLLKMPEGGPYVGVNIRYYGPQRFRTGGVMDSVGRRGGTMQEFKFGNLQAAVQVLGLDDPRVFENWHIRGDGARGSGRTYICK